MVRSHKPRGRPPGRPPRDALALRAQAGDRAAAEELFGGLIPWLAGAARRLVPCDDEASELAQETAARLWAALATFDPARGAFESLALATLRNRARDLWRARRRHREEPPGDTEPEDPREGPAAAAERADDVAAAEEVLAGMNPRDVEALRLRLAGATYKEAAEVTAAPLNTVASRVYRATNALRARLRARDVGRRGAA